MARYLILAFATLGISIAAAQSPARLVKDLNRSPGEFKAAIDWVMPVEQGVVFSMDSLATGKELWVSDGRPQGTRLLRDIVPGSQGSFPEIPVQAGEKVAFRVTDPSYRVEIWLTDGTPEGTTRIAGLPPLARDGSMKPLAGTHSGGVFYEAYGWDTNDPQGLWFTDGTPEGTPVLISARYTDAAEATGDGTRCYFLTDDHKVWRSDGTSGGTTMLLDFTEDASEGWPMNLKVAGGRLYITWADIFGELELWTCSLDGGDLVKLAPPGDRTWIQMWDVVGVGDGVYFDAREPDQTTHLWYSDGSVAGTREIPLIHEGAAYGPSGEFTEWNGALYFAASNVENGRALWRSDGTAEGTRLLKQASADQHGIGPLHLEAAEDFLYFQVFGKSGWELWRTEGTPAGTRRAANLLDNNAYSGSGPQIAASHGSLFYAAGRDQTSNALWRVRAKGRGAVRLTRPEKSSASSYPGDTDSSPLVPYEEVRGHVLSFVRTGNGTHELWRIGRNGSAVRSIWKLPGFSEQNTPLQFRAKVGQKAIFSATITPAYTQQLWVTDGSRRGTRLLVDHNSGPGGSTGFVHSAGTLFYSVQLHNSPRTSSLWKTDGTPQGTMQVLAADGTAPGVVADEMVDFKGALYFLSEREDGSRALWRSDGSTSGTVMVKDDWYPVAGAIAMSLTVVGERLSFALHLPTDIEIPWTSDGTKDGTVTVQQGYHENTVHHMGSGFDLGGLLIFPGRGRTINHPWEWWRSDGTDAGTYPLKPGITSQHIFPGYGPYSLGAVAGPHLFYAGMELTGDYDEVELWVTDGSAPGTRKLKDIEPGPEGSNPGNFLAVGNTVYFTASDVEHGVELWRSDGTEEGTVLAADVEPGHRSSFPQDLKVMNGKLYFHAQRNATGRELYVLDLPAE